MSGEYKHSRQAVSFRGVLMYNRTVYTADKGSTRGYILKRGRRGMEKFFVKKVANNHWTEA